MLYEINKKPVELTKEEKLANFVQGLKQGGVATYQQLERTFLSQFNSVWKNPQFKPQEIFDAVGKDSASLFIVAGKTIELLMTINPSFVPPTIPVEYEINKDGSVTVK